MTKATHTKPVASLTPEGRTGVSPSKIENKTRMCVLITSISRKRSKLEK